MSKYIFIYIVICIYGIHMQRCMCIYIYVYMYICIYPRRVSKIITSVPSLKARTDPEQVPQTQGSQVPVDKSLIQSYENHKSMEKNWHASPLKVRCRIYIYLYIHIYTYIYIYIDVRSTAADPCKKYKVVGCHGS